MSENNYIQLAGPLFEGVQSESLFADGKTFVDAIPKQDPEEILASFLKERETPQFDLKTFVTRHFTFPEEEQMSMVSTSSMEDYIASLWDILLKEMHAPSPDSTLISLPKPHIVPGGRFRECFYWDSYFVSLGLAASGEMEIVKDMVENFAYLIDTFGFIPNGNRVYFTSRSQPPYFSLLLRLLMEQGEEETALYYFPQLEKEYKFWMEGSKRLSPNKPALKRTVLVNGEVILNRYWDVENTPRPEAYMRETALAKESDNPEFYRNMRAACESGWDFSSRWLKDGTHLNTIQTLDILPIDLNCLLCHLEQTLALFAKKLGNEDKWEIYDDKANIRKEAIQKLFWNSQKGFFFDLHAPSSEHTNAWTLAAVAPLFLNLATEEQAQKVKKHLEEKFLLKGGFVTTLHEGEHQWDMPNGWAPLQWMTVKGLLNYSHHSLALDGTKRWLNLCAQIFDEKGNLFEKYNVRDCNIQTSPGEYTLQEGFGWTNGVILALKDLFGI